ncbi:MAG: hypothetical protein HRU75_09195 [Planctomycetia bacterium]|nr:MAG: hypothetical protein HRU75_09195 [Planctomycetia bacterium]
MMRRCAARPITASRTPKLTRDLRPSTHDPATAAAAVATALNHADPEHWLASHGIELVAWHAPAPVRAPRRSSPAGRVLGAWDPVLRRIELFEVIGLADTELVTVLAHELCHALSPRPQSRDEPRAERFSADFIATLDSERVALTAAAIRRIAQRICSHSAGNS